MAKYGDSLGNDNKSEIWWRRDGGKRSNGGATSCVAKGENASSPNWLLKARGVELFFTRIPAGSFKMGISRWRQNRNNLQMGAAYPWMTLAQDSQANAKRVKITRDFWMMQTQVTIEMFDVFLKTTKRNVPVGAIGYNKSTKKLEYGADYSFLNPGFPDINEQRSNVTMPATCVDWASAVAFCDWLNEEFKDWRTSDLLYKLNFRLPTEAEWEYACRAGSKAAYHFGNREKDLPGYGNYDDGNLGASAGVDGFEFLAQVWNLQPNRWQLYHMHGNVWEWCADWFAPYETSGWSAERDPNGPCRGYMRAARGGAWNVAPSFCRSASRAAVHPWTRAADLGFRVAMDVEPLL